MTTLCPICAKSMKQNGRAFQCEPCRQIVIFFRLADTSPYLESKRQSDHREAVTLKALARRRPMALPGQTKLLPLMLRIAPNTIKRKVAAS
jgi:hypothetical protein